MLKTSEVIPYLRQRNIVNDASIVEDHLRVFDASRRNRNFRVVRDHGPSLFIKQGTSGGGTNPPKHEATVHSLLSKTTCPYGHIAPVVAYDDTQNIVISELIAGGQNLREYHLGRRALPVGVAAAVGEALGELHGNPVSLSTAADAIGHGYAGALNAHRPGLTLLSDFSGSSIDLMRLLQRSPALTRELESLRADWQRDAVIHCDIRWENMVLAEHHRKRRIWLVDWETATVGDSAWDLGSAIGDYLGHWLMSIPITGTDAPERHLHLAAFPLESVQPAIRALWKAYLRSSRLRPLDRKTFLRRSTRYAGLKLVQSAVEQIQGSARWTLTAVSFMQVAENIMTHPEDGARVLLGLKDVV